MKRLLLTTLALYFIGLAVGYVRLPLAAIKNVGGYGILGPARPGTVWSGSIKGVSPVQRWWLNRAFAESSTPGRPSVEVSVQWNAVVCARVDSGYFYSDEGAEDKDCVYVCVFGVWIPVHLISHSMA